MINRLSNPINRNRSAAKISKVMSSTPHGMDRGKLFRVGDNSTSNGSTTTSTLLKPLLLLQVLLWMGETVSGLEEGRPLIKTEPPTNGDVPH